MITLGLNNIFHDSSAALLKDGKIIAAIEEERLNRIKHTTKQPLDSARACLQIANVSIENIDAIAVNTSESTVEKRIKFLTSWGSVPHALDAVEYKTNQLRQAGFVDFQKLCFVEHHLAHALSAFIMSGFDKALVLSNDGFGDDASMSIWYATENKKLKCIKRINIENSLGLMYEQVTSFLGYSRFDEFKVMGLASYGNPKRFENIFLDSYYLNSNGDFSVDRVKLLKNLYKQINPKKKEEPFQQKHMDLAASCQKALENIVFHVLNFYSDKFSRNLAMAGGVSLNCVLNGKILCSRIFDNVFVQPASHDAGGAIGAAFHAYNQLTPNTPIKIQKLANVYLGSPIPSEQKIESIIKRWSSVVEFGKDVEIFKKAAIEIQRGAVIGWVQGRSEFGPRALGNRSIIADPRPKENSDIVNKLIKKRETYRPFAPSVIEEKVHDFFEFPTNIQQSPFMLFTVPVKYEKRKILGAVTHIDGTARVQTVSKKQNSRFWNLISEFGKLTGVPVLLNTSFNNSHEPIVDSVEDAIICFLTTNLTLLVVGDFWIRKKEIKTPLVLDLIPKIPQDVILQKKRSANSIIKYELSYLYEFEGAKRDSQPLSPVVANLLFNADGIKSVGVLLHEMRSNMSKEVTDEIMSLWEKRLIALKPC